MATTLRGPALAAVADTRWRTRDIVVAAVIGVAFGVVFWVWNLSWDGPLKAALRVRAAAARPGLRDLAGPGRPRAAGHPQARRRAVRRDGRGRRVGAPRQPVGRRHAAVRVRPGRRRGARLRVHAVPRLDVPGPRDRRGRQRARPRGSTTGSLYYADVDLDVQLVRGVADGDLGGRPRGRRLGGAPSSARSGPACSKGSRTDRRAGARVAGGVVARDLVDHLSRAPTGRRSTGVGVRPAGRARACWSSGRRGPARARSPWRSRA